MAITTQDGVVAGMKPPVSFYKGSFTGEAAGYFHSLFGVSGIPGAGTLGSPGLNGASVTTTTLGGALPYANPAAGLGYLAKTSIAVGANIIGFLLYDLLWYNSGITVTTTTAQNITFSGLPSRCPVNGSTTPDANGNLIEAWLYCSTATTNVGAVTNTTISYTDEAGNAGNTGTIVTPGWPATAVAGTFHMFSLAGSDAGVRSVQSITLGTSYGAGAVNLMLIRRLAFVPFSTATSGALLDWAALGLPQIFDSSAIYAAVLLSGTAAGTCAGDIAFAHG